MRVPVSALLVLCCCCLSPANRSACAQGAQGAETLEHKPATAEHKAETVEQKTAGMTHMPGFVPLDYDARTGHLYLEIAPLDAGGRSAELLLTNSLPYGAGSNDLGLDRGQTGEGRVVRFERFGPRLLLVEPNQNFRTTANDPAEVLSVTQSFPSSVLWGFPIAAESANGTVLVDATEFFLRDMHHVLDALSRNHQGVYKVDAARSAIALDGTKAFPKNAEVEALLTFTTEGGTVERGSGGGNNFVRDVTPDPQALTLRERTSLVELPALGAANAAGTFTPRRFTPRAGYFPAMYRDEAAPLGDPLEQRFLIRHRLNKRDPACTRACVAVAPIQYYVDRGAPEPVRSALLEGARWWDAAFQAAGWAPGTFRVDLLPANADPMDIRYNIIQWVHRYTRGWSYGAAVTDPRTGEILKGNVTLGALRGRQDYLIAEALLSPYTPGQSLPAEQDPLLQMVLARLRQLAAHETGHTLGLAHNFAASTVAQSDSVMDYPHPYVTLDEHGKPDLTHAYAVGIGAWDKVAIDYGYREFDRGGRPVEDDAALARILSDSDKAGQVFLTDEDARPLGSASPIDHLWDNGHDPVAELDRVLTIRAAALRRFGVQAIRPGVPMAELEKTLAPLYLFHRYQTEAAVKLLGGLDYRYNLRGDGLPGPVMVTPSAQRAALAAVLRTLSAQTLTLPEPLLAILPPVPPGFERSLESLPAHTGLTFDPVAAAEAAADLTLAGLMQPQRAARLVEYHARNAAEPSLTEVLDATFAAVAERPAGDGLDATISRAVALRAVEALLTLAANPTASSEARSIARAYAITLKSATPAADARGSHAEADLHAAIAARITQFEAHPETFVPAKTVEAPPGMPIGDEDEL